MARPILVTSPTATDDDQAPPDPPDGSTGRSLPPRTPYEDAIVGILGDVLGCTDIEVHDRLLALGDVAQAPRVVAQIRKTIGVDIPVADYVESQTVAGLASVVAAKSYAARSASRPHAVAPRPPDARPVLSFDQQRLWMENQLLPGVIYNVHGRRRIVGTLDVKVIEASIRAIVARHETLRTRFPATDAEPVQIVDDPDDDWRVTVTDLTGRHGRDGDDFVEREARRLLDEELTKPFDLTTGPLIRCLLIKLSDTEHALGVTMHHIVSDAWSIGLFVRELTALYRAGGDPVRAGLSPLPVQYRDYAVWQRGWLTGDALEHQLSHWRSHLRDAPRVLALPTVQRRTSAMRAEAGQVVAELSREDTAALHDLCREHGVTSFMVLYAVLATIFSRWSGQTDIVIGVPVAGRTNSVTDRLIGFFVNMLPLRIDLSDNPAFVDLLGRVRRVALDGYAHAEAPMDELVRDLNIARDPRRTPLFEVVLNVVASPEAEEVASLAIETMETPSLFSRYDLTFTAQESGGVLRFKLDFPADRCDPATGRVLLRQLSTLLRAATTDPAVRLLDEPAEEPASVGHGPTDPSDHPPPGLAVARPAAGSDLVAVADGDGRWSYRWLSRAADRVAEVLTGRGVTAADRVGVVRRPNAAFVAVLTGAASAGVTCTVIETDDPALTGPLGLTTVLDASPAGEPAAGTVDLSPLLRADTDTGAAGEVDPARADPAGARRSGTATADWAVDRFGFGPDDRFVVLSSRPGHLISAIGSAFGAGATLVIPDRAFGDDIDALTVWLRDNAITVAYADPSLLRALCARPPVPGLPALRCVVVDNSGDLLPHDIEAVREMAPGCRCVAVYRVMADGRPLAYYDAPSDLAVGTAPLRVPLGTPLPGQPVALRRAGGQAAATGEVAEIWHGADRTGDLGRRWPDGTLAYAGPSGASPTFDPVETVSALRDVPGVRDALVTEQAGPDGTTTLLGYVAGPDPELGTMIVHNHVKARLPDYLVPRHLFVLESLPRTPWGGYDLRALPRPTGDTVDGDDYAAPRTPMERQLTGILEELLDIERVGIYDSFFELGGFSMLATRLVTRVREAFGVQLAVRDVFESPTVDELARLIVRAQGEQSDLDFEALLAEIEQATP
jgi:non-ribosomal peptide synthetase component F